ncbi:unnamed protein product [Lampetra planeri]
MSLAAEDGDMPGLPSRGGEESDQWTENLFSRPGSRRPLVMQNNIFDDLVRSWVDLTHIDDSMDHHHHHHHHHQQQQQQQETKRSKFLKKLRSITKKLPKWLGHGSSEKKMKFRRGECLSTSDLHDSGWDLTDAGSELADGGWDLDDGGWDLDDGIMTYESFPTLRIGSAAAGNL